MQDRRERHKTSGPALRVTFSGAFPTQTRIGNRNPVIEQNYGIGWFIGGTDGRTNEKTHPYLRLADVQLETSGVILCPTTKTIEIRYTLIDWRSVSVSSQQPANVPKSLLAQDFIQTLAVIPVYAHNSDSLVMVAAMHDCLDYSFAIFFVFLFRLTVIIVTLRKRFQTFKKKTEHLKTHLILTLSQRPCFV